MRRIFQNKENQVVASNYASLFILQISNYVLPLLVLPYLIRVIGTENFGLVMFAQSISTFLTVFVDFGFNISGTRAVSLVREEKSKLSQTFIAIGFIKIILLILSFLALLFIVFFLEKFSKDMAVYLLSFGIVVGQAIFPVWFFQGIEKMKIITILNISAKVIFTLLIFVFVKAESDYLYVPLFNSLGFLISGILALIFSVKFIEFNIPSKKFIINIFNESRSLFVSNVAVALYTSVNIIILGLFTNNAIVGVYSSIEKLILAIKNIYTPLYQAIFPWLSKKSKKLKPYYIKKMMPYVLLSGIFITAIILTFGDLILDILYDDKLINNYIIIFNILSFIAIFSGLNMLFNTLYFPAIKKYSLRMKIMIFAGIFNFVLSIILSKIYRIYGMAISVTITEFFLLCLALYYFKKIKIFE